jgi:hypothetical protein
MVAMWGDVSLGSYFCSMSAGSVRVARRDSIGVRRGSCVPAFSPLGSLAMMVLVGCMWSVYSLGARWCMVMSVFHLLMPISQSRARCLRS